MSSEQDDQQVLEATAPAPDAPLCGFGEISSCITCSDVALPVRVLSVERGADLALAEMLGASTEIDVSLIEAVTPGDWLLVHGGVAIAHIDGEDDSSGSLRLAEKG